MSRDRPPYPAVLSLYKECVRKVNFLEQRLGRMRDPGKRKGASVPTLTYTYLSPVASSTVMFPVNRKTMLKILIKLFDV